MFEYLAQFVFHVFVVLKGIHLTLSVCRPACTSIQHAETVVRHDIGRIVRRCTFQK
jgi:hypothetical protein